VDRTALLSMDLRRLKLADLRTGGKILVIIKALSSRPKYLVIGGGTFSGLASAAGTAGALMLRPLTCCGCVMRKRCDGPFAFAQASWASACR
jgi:hypothetical protein